MNLLEVIEDESRFLNQALIDLIVSASLQINLAPIEVSVVDCLLLGYTSPIASRL